MASKKTLCKLLLHSVIIFSVLSAFYLYSFATIFKNVSLDHSYHYIGKEYAYKFIYIYASVFFLPFFITNLVYSISSICDVVLMNIDQKCVRIFRIQSKKLLFCKKQYYLLYTKKFNYSNGFFVWLSLVKDVFMKAVYICSEDEIDLKTFNKMVELERYEKLDDIRYQLTFHKHSRVITQISRL